MRISVVIPSIGRPSFERVYKAAQEADEVIVSKTGKQLVENLNEGVAKTRGDIIVFLSERGEPKKFWITDMLLAFEKIHNYGVVSFHPNIVQAGAMTRNYMEDALGGYFFWPDYIHYHADQELGERARKQNNYVEALNIITTYLKPDIDSFQKMNNDAAKQDSKMYYKRERLNFPNIRIRNSKL